MTGPLQRLLSHLRGDDADDPPPDTDDIDDFDDPVLLARTPGAKKYHAPRPNGTRPRCGGSTPEYRLVERADAAADHEPCGNPACRTVLDAEN